MLNTKTLLKSTQAILCRQFSVSCIQRKSIPLSSNPTYHSHSLENSPKFAISFLSSNELTKPDALIPQLIIGWTPEQDKVEPRTFIENPAFVNFVTKTFQETIHKVDDTNLKALADWQKEGWMHINDERNPPAWGRISFPEDIIGSVQLDKGTIVPGTYQPMPTHRMVTNDGIFQLSEPLVNCIKEASKKLISST